ncbi:hypothetical protein [Priestia koreensis]|uniref:hypothetical protein n=1 Tax=Priestia koreensis TaxID=284581 RepID=UPI001F5AB1F8|nr:hypothetical protein [Priestia koreensis]UNL87051.1 hypothetical protein IE339_11445 [Priestia koreensis]
MKHFMMIGLLFVLLVNMTGCQQSSLTNKVHPADVREAVWDQLTDEKRHHIKGTWRDASVKKVVFQKSMGSITDKSFIGKEVYMIDYPANDSLLLGDVGVFADVKSFKIIGYGYRD